MYNDLLRDNKLRDVLGRNVEIGDFVYFFRYHLNHPIKYGIIESVSDRKICTLSGTVYCVNDVYLITNPDEVEQKLYKEIYNVYKEKNNL